MILAATLFLGGLASGLHCVGMCGGISAAASVLHPNAFWKRQLVFNLGRVTSYAAAGAAAGALGSAGAYAAAALPAQGLVYVFASLFMLLAGAHLAGAFSFDQLGLPLWRRLQPLAARLLPGGSYAAGLVWGWLPCGLVYAALLAAAFAGGPAQGAAAMAAFGAGTLPWLLVTGVGTARLRGWRGFSHVRRAAGALLIVTGAWGLAAGIEQTLLCL
jgi:sulfite exporter TauE/SafE